MFGGDNIFMQALSLLDLLLRQANTATERAETIEKGSVKLIFSVISPGTTRDLLGKLGRCAAEKTFARGLLER